ncbi:MAG: 1-acyl-sn-glycerol-3-phosphate acyltransferase [Myxococcales bacterium]|nr:1-acyl-sn-glycerol-3-phosphate acyltransferase [Myxococcales bacterium]MDH3843610.1 1-acyl-sn-glycerol-3-phosphate acyltransferase [Myxococcales bacterium]
MAITTSSAVRLVRLLVGMFFRRVGVAGTNHVPETGGGILIAWHPNGLVDPALIVSTFPRQVVFGARHGLFKWPIVGQVMRALGTVPIYRAVDLKDADDEARRNANRKSLDALAQAVCEGRFAALFPEGVSHDAPFLQELKTGAARLYYRAKQLSHQGGVQPVIIPVGLHYDDKTSFRSDALVEFHAPIELTPELDAPIPDDDDEMLRARSSELTVELEPILQEVTHATESWELNRLMGRVRSLMRAERAKRAGANLKAPDMAERTLGMARVWRAYHARVKTDPEAVEALLDKVAAYDSALREVKLDDDDLDKPPPIESKWIPLLLGLQAAVVFLVFPPVLVLGLLINVGPYFLTNLASKLAARQYKDTATVKLLAGMILFPLTWLTFALLVGLGQIQVHESFAGIPRAPWAAGVTTFLIGALGGALALVYLELVDRTWTSIKIRAKRKWGATIIEQLSQERAVLFEALEDISQGLDLPGRLRDDGRISATPGFALDRDDMP